ncbi:MAG: folE, partial [Spirosoma sp.]|nr:folE [Spirosoma sp.]
LQIDDVAVFIKAEHLCVASRGVNDVGCTTLTSSLHGQFLTESTRHQLHSLLSL